jgi:hypothetical protein
VASAGSRFRRKLLHEGIYDLDHRLARFLAGFGSVGSNTPVLLDGSGFFESLRVISYFPGLAATDSWRDSKPFGCMGCPILAGDFCDGYSDGHSFLKKVRNHLFKKTRKTIKIMVGELGHLNVRYRRLICFNQTIAHQIGGFRKRPYRVFEIVPCLDQRFSPRARFLQIVSQ